MIVLLVCSFVCILCIYIFRALSPMLSPEERDARTIFVWQLAARIRPRDLEEFFSSVGEVRDVRLILDNKTRKSKGIAYVEFRDVASLPMALALSGSKVLGVPIQIQASQAEKNRAGQPSSILANLASSGLAAVGAAASGAFSPLSMGMASAGNGFGSTSGPVKLYVGSLHPQINEDMLRSIFEPFGHINDIQLTRNLLTNRSAGNGFVLFRRAEDAQRALDQLNGFELAGKNMKVSTIPEAVRDELSAAAAVNAPIISGGESLIDPATQLALMATKLVTQGNGQNLAGIANLLASASAMSDYPMDSMAPTPSMSSGASVASVDTPCFMLTNMFSPEDKNAVSAEIRSDVIEECSAHGSILHVFVDFDSAEGNVYVKARSSNVAKQCVTTIHGRYFSGRLVTAAYVPLDSYHELFPDSINANEDLEP